MLSPQQASAAVFDARGASVFAPRGYSRISNFAGEVMRVPRCPESERGDGDDRDRVFRFENSGDLVGECFLEVAVVGEPPPDLRAALLLDVASLEIGGEVVDAQPGRWIDAAPFLATAQREAVARLGSFEPDAARETWTAFVPLPFWFCRSPDQALPLVAASRQHVEVRIEFAPGARVAGADLYANMIYVDEHERRGLLSRPQSRLIERVQLAEFDAPPGTERFDARLNLRGLVKCIFFEASGSDVAAASLLINGVQRFGPMPSRFWSAGSLLWSSPDRCALPPGMHAMPLCTAPWSSQPTGAMNCSLLERIDLRLDLCGARAEAGAEVRVYAWGYAFLRIADGRVALIA